MQEATNKVVNIQEAKREPWEIEWERCKPYIAKAVKHQDSYTIDDVEDKIRNGIALLWPGKESAIVTEFAFFSRKKIMHILCVSGKFEELEEMFKCIENYAREVGIKKITGSGRKGWLRKIKHLGFKPDYVVSKDL